MKYLIINADDFGWSRDVVDVIIEGHKKRLFTSTTLMATMPAFEYGIKQLRENPDLGAGVHLTLFDGKPVQKPERVPSLINPDTGNFISLEEAQAVISQFDPVEVYIEFRAQIEKCITYGINPTHLDVHCHPVYTKRKLFETVLKLAKEYSLPVRSPFGKDLFRKLSVYTKRSGIPKILVYLMGHSVRRRIQKACLNCPDYFLDGFTFGDQSYETLKRILSTLPEGVSELITHPGREDSFRKAEYDVWFDTKTSALLDNSYCKLVNFSFFQENK